MEATIQNERNDRESFLQTAQIEREKTAVQVNEIYLEESKTIQTAEAQADLIRARARVEASQIEADAQINGTRDLIRRVNMTSQEHLTAFMYIRALTNHKDAAIDLKYLPPESILPISNVGG